MEEQQQLKIEEKKSTRICPICKEPYKTKIGINNWKNLFRKPTLDDWIVLVILILIFFASYAYTTETKYCKEVLNNIDQVCLQRGKNINYTTAGVPIVTLPENMTIIDNSYSSDVDNETK